jgi:hypothetical protein
VAESRQFRPTFSDSAAEFILALPKRRQKTVMARAYELAKYPLIESDYRLPDEDGRPIDHLLIDGLLFSYWVDHASRLVMITEIEAIE